MLGLVVGPVVAVLTRTTAAILIALTQSQPLVRVAAMAITQAPLAVAVAAVRREVAAQALPESVGVWLCLP